jgi:hypothetical protein
VALGVAFSAGALVAGASGSAPAVGNGEGAADGELTSHPTNSASAISKAYTKRRLFINGFPIFFSERPDAQRDYTGLRPFRCAYRIN